MQKTKLGVSIGIVGAALCFLGCISYIPAVLLAAYVLIFEENEWLKKTAVKMMIVTISFSLALVGIGLIKDIFGLVDTCIGWLLPFRVDIPFNLDIILHYIFTFLQDFILIVMGFKALSLGTVKSSFMDKMIDKHM